MSPQQKAITLESIKLVSWDIDGTLYSLGHMKWQLLRRFLREVVSGRGLLAQRELMTLREHKERTDAARRSGASVAKVWKGPWREMLLETEKRWYGQAIHETGPRAGVVAVLSFFAEKDIPQVVLSDYQGEYKLDSLGIRDRFASVYEGERLGFVKPNPKLFEHIAAAFEIPMASLLHIGDRVDTDKAGALAAGCQCLILGRDFQSFEYLLGRFREGSSLRTLENE